MAASKTPKNKQLADLAKMLKKSNDAAALSASQGVVMPSLAPGAAAAPVMDTTEGATMMGADNGLQYQGQMMGLNDREKALNLQMAGMNPGVAPEVKTDPRRAYIAAGLGLLGALFNKGNNGTRQAGFGAMQNVLSAAERERQDKANRAAQAQALDFQTKLRTYQAQLGNIGIDKNALIAGENQKTAQAKAESDAKKWAAEFGLKQDTLDETKRKNLSTEELNAYKATPQFKRDYDAQIQMGVLPARAEANVLAKFQQDINRAFLIKAQTASTEQMTKMRPLIEDNKQKQWQAILGATNNRYYDGLAQKQEQFDQTLNFKEQEAAAKAAESEAKYPTYGGMPRDQQIGAAKAKINSIVAELKKAGITGDGMLSKAAIAANPRLKKLMEDFVYWNEVTRKISTGQRLSRDPWAPPGLADQKQMKGRYAPLLPPTIGLRPSSAPAGPIGKK